jgi:uncharacterized protein YdhG (YjbR/CyaY superfamily)
MASKRPATIAEYIDAAPAEAKPHLTRLYAILKGVAPKAEEAIKWGTPFFVEPRFLFAFSSHKAHVGFTSSNDALDPYREDLAGYEITRMGILKIPYSKPIPESTIRKIAKARLRIVSDRDDESFW